jgi:dGTP triphosphohydrolase
MGVLDAWIGDLFGAYGDKPVVPYLLPTDTAQAQRKAIGNNLGNFDVASQLASKTNTFNQEEAQRAFNEFTGGQGAGLFQKSNENISDYLSGIIPDDVSAAVNRSSAAKALGGGFGGSQMQGNLTARDLGLTSLDLQKFGVSALPQSLGAQQALRGAPRIGPESMFMSPQIQIGLDDKYNDQLFSRNWLANRIEASPDPTSVAYAQGISDDIGGITNAVGSMYGLYTNGTPQGTGGSGGGGSL